MEQVFWYQNAKLSGSDVFIIDGSLCQTELDIAEKDQAFALLLDIRRYPQAKQSLSLPKRLYPKASPGIEVYLKGDNEAMVQSHFLDRDETGRLIPYMFYTKDASALPGQLEQCSKMAGLALNPEDIKLYEKIVWMHRNRTALMVGGVVCAGVLLYYLCN